MPEKRSLGHHAGLVRGMARTLGVDLSSELVAGELPAQVWLDAVIRCSDCEATDACQHWLADPAAGDAASDAASAPDFCRNAGLMDALRSGPGEG